MPGGKWITVAGLIALTAGLPGSTPAQTRERPQDYTTTMYLNNDFWNPLYKTEILREFRVLGRKHPGVAFTKNDSETDKIKQGTFALVVVNGPQGLRKEVVPGELGVTEDFDSLDGVLPTPAPVITHWTYIHGGTPRHARRWRNTRHGWSRRHRQRAHAGSRHHWRKAHTWHKRHR